jgi:hypothetical protein
MSYIADKVKEAGIEAIVVSMKENAILPPVEYTLNSMIVIGYARYGVIQRYSAYDLIKGYHHEWLNEWAEMYVNTYHKALERLRSE